MIISGNVFSDNRGKLFFNNTLDLSEVKRMYIIENSNIDIVRAWQAHKIEKRWFVAVEGEFEIKLVQVDNFEDPSDDLQIQSYQLNANFMDCLCVEPGFATSIRAKTSNAKLAVFSDYLLGEVVDYYKFDSGKWK